MVRWFPWGQAAFSAAQQRNLPIFLVVHEEHNRWCESMAAACFEDPGIAQALNESFLPVIVDAHERPDITTVAQRFLAATIREGGLPLTLFLTPTGHPILGGRYYSADDGKDERGLRSLIDWVRQLWETEPDRLLAEGTKMAEALERLEASRVPGELPGPEAMEALFISLLRVFNPDQGGFTGAPKFPRVPQLASLLRHADSCARSSESMHGRSGRAQQMVAETLMAMARGGICDHLGGGFHHCSVDDFWRVPTFEKRLIDQLLVSSLLLEIWQITGTPVLADTVRRTLDYVLGELSSNSGGFIVGEEARGDVTRFGEELAGEGAFYTWKWEEIDLVLDPEEANVFRTAFGIAKGGNVRPAHDHLGRLVGRNVLWRLLTMADICKITGLSEEEANDLLASGMEKIFRFRKSRPRPLRNEWVLTGLNGLAVGVFARAGRMLAEPRYVGAALETAQFIEEQLFDPDQDQLIRGWVNGGTSHFTALAFDYAGVISGLIDLYETTFDVEHLRWAAGLQQIMDERFQDKRNGGFFESADPLLPISFKIDREDEEPATNSLAAVNLVRLWAMTGQEPWKEGAMRIVRAFASVIAERPSELPLMVCASEMLRETTMLVAIARGDDWNEWQGTGREGEVTVWLRKLFLPFGVMIGAGDPALEDLVGEPGRFYTSLKPVDNRTTMFVRRRGIWEPPVTTIEALDELLLKEA